MCVYISLTCCKTSRRERNEENSLEGHEVSDVTEKYTDTKETTDMLKIHREGRITRISKPYRKEF